MSRLSSRSSRWAIVLLAAASICDASTLQLADVFSDHMVLQRHAPIRVWGHAEKGARVEVRLGRDAPTWTTAGDDGAWQLELPIYPAGGPHRLIATSGDDKIVLADVLVGEVWLASGQSNMQWSVTNTVDATEAIAAADGPEIRLLSVPLWTAFEPTTKMGADWQVCTPETIPSFSAVAYFFGQRLHQQLGVPIGLINSSWGGTRIEPWTDAEHIDWLISRLPGADARTVRDAVLERDQLAPEFDAAYRRHQASVEKLKQAEAETSTLQADLDFDDADWPNMNVPGTWEDGGLPDFDGMVWFRRHLQVPDAWAGKDLILHLGPVDEVDVTWFNGEQIGATGSFSNRMIDFWNEPRVYEIDGQWVRPGRAVLSVRAIDSAFAGGLWGAEADEMYLTPADGSGEKLTIAGSWKYQPGTKLESRGRAVQQLPSVLYNRMIHPLVPMSLAGAIWYQGESNVSEGAAYTEKMLALIDGWRQVFDQGDLPFYFVQLAPFRYGNPAALPLLWEAQTRVSQRRANVGDVAINDVGDVEDIHPRDKQTVGERLANLALKRTYRIPGLWDQGPRFASLSPEAGTLRVLFDHAGGLTTRDGRPPTGFEIAGEDGRYLAAKATIEGEFVAVSHPSVAEPVSVRFAWDQEASPNLVNGGGLPATPFRTDSLPAESAP